MPHDVASMHQSLEHVAPVQESTGEPEKKDTEMVRAFAISFLLFIAIEERG
jgi:hypothetical protein